MSSKLLSFIAITLLTLCKTKQLTKLPTTIQMPLNHEKNKVLEKSKEEFQNENQAKINFIQTTIFIDPEQLICDVKYQEIASFSFSIPQLTIYYTIISAKTPYYNFSVSSLTDGVQVSNMSVFVDKSFKDTGFIDEFNNSINFKDRWIIAVDFKAPTMEVDLKFLYFSERAMLIDQTDKTNLLKLTLFNPYNQSISHKVDLRLTGFNTLSKNLLKVPNDTKIELFNYLRNSKVMSNGFLVSFERLINPFTQYEMFLSLPMEIKTCETGFLNVVYYTLIVVTVVFVLISLLSALHIYKE